MPNIVKQRQNLHQQLKDSEARIKNLQQQIHFAQKLSTIGTMGCLVAHEFNNILVPMINYAELALKHENDVPLMQKALKKTIEHGNRAALIIRSMLNLVRDHAQNRRLFRLKDIVDECFLCLARDLKKDGINVTIRVPDDLMVFAVSSQVLQVLLNLIINARQAMLARGGQLTLEAAETHAGAVTIAVIDTGCGIEPRFLDKIFEPFFTTKTDALRPDQQGTGLGLAVCKNIMDAHHGSISVTSSLGEGTTFTLTLPPADNSAQDMTSPDLPDLSDLT